jgi:hypothetical protein
MRASLRPLLDFWLILAWKKVGRLITVRRNRTYTFLESVFLEFRELTDGEGDQYRSKESFNEIVDIERVHDVPFIRIPAI